MKKLISIFLSIALLCTMVFPVFATEVGTATVDTVTGVHGETVFLTLNLSDFDEADTILVTFEVPEALELILEDSEWLLDASVLTDISDGMAVCATAAPEELSGDILTLALRLPAEGDLEPVYEINYQVTLRKYNNIVAEVQVKGAVATSADATKVTVSQSTLTLDLNGTKQATLTAAVEPIYSTDTVSWSSSDVTVATVDENGVVTAVKKGSATITATAGQCSDSCTVNVMCSHQEIVDKAVDPDCVNTGLTEGKHCSVCGEILVAQKTVDALNHSWTPADCETPKTCKVCGETEGEALGHDWVDADCETPKTCKVCGETEGKALGHTVVTDKAVAPTCTTTGLTEGKHCSVCNKVLAVQQVVPANGHKDGNKDYICDICNEDLCTNHQETVMAGKDATCTENGLTEGKKCALCGDIIKAQKVIPAKGHTEVTDKAVAATCTAAGKTEGKHCSVCGAVTKAQQTVPAKGHTEVTDKAVAATCTAAGKTEGKHCSVCGAVTKAQQTVPAKGHTEVTDKAVAATCAKPGKTEGKHCKTCGAVIVAQSNIPAVGHKYDNNVDGTCNVCGVHRENVETRVVVHMFRMYNPNTGEHFYTGSTVERDNLTAVGWQYEGVGFTFPANTGAPVHRLFQPSTGEHLYTMDVAEKDKLMAEGWNYEGIAFNSAYDTEAVQHRLHNPNATVGAYHFTFSAEEKQNLIDAGWEYQGIGWYSCWK